MKNIYAITVIILLSINAFQANAQIGKKLLEKAEKAKEELTGKGEVEVVGDEGMVYVYATADRTDKITDITGLTKIYCTAYVHKKKFSRVVDPSNKDASCLLFIGNNCNLNDNSYTDDCNRYFLGVREEILKDDGRGSYKLVKEKFDFEIDLVAATEEDVKRNDVPKGKDFFVVVGIRDVFLSTSEQLTFDIEAGASSYGEAEIAKNKDLKLKKSAMQDADLEKAVKKLFLERGMTEVTNVSFYSGWTIERDEAGNPLRRWCKVNLSGKEDGQCKFYWCRVWEEYQDGGKYQLPFDKNENFNRLNRELVPCENL